MARQNKSNELAEILRYQITSGQLRENEQLEAISKLATRYSTTVVTVSKALAILESGGYVKRIPNKGVFVKATQSCRLALVMDSIFSYDSNSVALLPIILKELERTCRAENWSYELFFNVNDRFSSQNLLLKLSQNAFDVVLIGSLWLAQNAVEIFKGKSVFTVGIYPYKELDFSITFDSCKMVYDAVLELSKRGCRQIALIDNNRDLSWAKIQDYNIKGYNDALKSIGRLRNSRLHFKVPISQQGGYNALGELLKNNLPRPLGIVSVDSVITLGIIQAALSHNLRIPEDVIIATHANHGCGASQFIVPIIKYEYDVNTLFDRLAMFIKLHNAGGNLPVGIDLISPGKEVLCDKMLSTAIDFV